MEKTKSIAAISADLQATLTNELGTIIKKRVLFYLDGIDKLKKVSPYERELIAENAWAHVLEKRAKYRASEGAKFITWATKVAKNFAQDELKKLFRDPLHLAGTLEAGFQTTFTNQERVDYVSVGDGEDYDRRQYCHDVLETTNGIVAGYSGRDRKIAEMLMCECTKEEIMKELQMSGALTDTCICRLRKRMRADLLKAGYSLA